MAKKKAKPKRPRLVPAKKKKHGSPAWFEVMDPKRIQIIKDYTDDYLAGEYPELTGHPRLWYQTLLDAGHLRPEDCGFQGFRNWLVGYRDGK